MKAMLFELGDIQSQLESNNVEHANKFANVLNQDNKTKRYVPLMSRPKCGTYLFPYSNNICVFKISKLFLSLHVNPYWAIHKTDSLEVKVEHYLKRRKLEIKTDNNK